MGNIIYPRIRCHVKFLSLAAHAARSNFTIIPNFDEGVWTSNYSTSKQNNWTTTKRIDLKFG